MTVFFIEKRKCNALKNNDKSFQQSYPDERKNFYDLF